MYITHLKTVAVEAMKQTFDSDFPEGDFQDLLVSQEYPATQGAYPSIWVDWEPGPKLQAAGINHFEIGDPAELGGPDRRFSRWRFEGSITYTAVALSNFERDRLVDQMIKVFAFGRENPATSYFRNYLEDNEFVGVTANFDSITQQGFASTPGTPWGTADTVYEGTLALYCIGEFVSNGIGDLVTISDIQIHSQAPTEPDPLPGQEGWV